MSDHVADRFEDAVKLANYTLTKYSTVTLGCDVVTVEDNPSTRLARAVLAMDPVVDAAADHVARAKGEATTHKNCGPSCSWVALRDAISKFEEDI